MFGEDDPNQASSAEDSSRRMKALDLNETAVETIACRLRKTLHENGLLRPNGFVEMVSLLRCLPRAKAQYEHEDYNPNSESFWQDITEDGYLPFALSGMVALQDGTTITTGAGEKISIPTYSLCVWRGDLEHRGSAYDEENIRFHLYFSLPGCTVPRDPDNHTAVQTGEGFLKWMMMEKANKRIYKEKGVTASQRDLLEARLSSY